MVLATAMPEIPPEVEEYKQDIRDSLRWHTRFVYGHTMPWHQLVWTEALEDMSIKRLLIVAPPKWGKSPTIGDYITWRIGNDPENYHCIYVSNTSTQANKYSVAVRDTIAYNENFRFLYSLEPDPNKGWSEREWFIKRKNEADKDPTLQSCGVGGPILGATVQEVIYDDIADRENMATDYQRKSLMDWVRKVPSSRLVPGGRMIMICTRWHEQDPAAIYEEEGWVVIHIPAIDDNGESTYPQFWSVDDLIGDKPESARTSLGVRDFEMMFQGRVLPAEGGIFKREWWRYWHQGKAPWQYQVDDPRYQRILGIVHSWDTAFKEKQQNDFSVCTIWAVTKTHYYLLDVWRGKVDFPKLKVVVESLYNQWKPIAVLIEDAASGQSLIQELRARSAMPVIAVKVDSSKTARANAVTPTIAASKVLIPEEAPWRHTYEYEHEIFPGGAHDDQVDSTTQFLNWIRYHSMADAGQMSGVQQESKWQNG